jgi:SNF2 family DNA or RNA helicase
MNDLMSSFILYQAEKLSRYKLRPVSPKLRLRLTSGIDFLEGPAEVDLDGERFSYARFLEEYRKQSFILLSDGSRAYPDRGEMERLERLIRPVGSGEKHVRVSFFDYPELLRAAGFQAEGEAWQRAGSFYRGYNGIPARAGDFAVFGSGLRPYQEYGVRWLDYLHEHSFGGCLADEMGLGKTIQTIGLLRKIYAAGEKAPTLIVMPKSLLYNWKSELARFAPELNVLLYYGAGRDLSALEPAQVLLTSYAAARIDVEALSGFEFHYLILDESQAVKNLGAKTTLAMFRIKARHRLALSGTPMENNLGELYALFSFLNPGMFGSQADFARKYLRPIQEKQDAEALHDLKARIHPFILRRNKRDVLPDLPEKVEQVACLELSREHLELYNRRRLELKRDIDRALHEGGMKKNLFLILQAFTELRRLASVPEADGGLANASAKREYLGELVPGIVENGHKCLIFTNYLASVDLVSQDLAAAGIGNLVMTGATSDRQSLVQRFQTDPAVSAFVMTLKTGGLGLNLTAADYVFIFDPWWNRSAEAQAVDRTHRIGQKNTVFCYRMIARGTIEEKILELQEKKASLVASLITSDAEAFKQLDEDDIRYLLE